MWMCNFSFLSLSTFPVPRAQDAKGGKLKGFLETEIYFCHVFLHSGPMVKCVCGAWREKWLFWLGSKEGHLSLSFSPYIVLLVVVLHITVQYIPFQ